MATTQNMARIVRLGPPSAGDIREMVRKEVAIETQRLKAKPPKPFLAPPEASFKRKNNIPVDKESHDKVKIKKVKVKKELPEVLSQCVVTEEIVDISSDNLAEAISTEISKSQAPDVVTNNVETVGNIADEPGPEKGGESSQGTSRLGEAKDQTEIPDGKAD